MEQKISNDLYTDIINNVLGQFNTLSQSEKITLKRTIGLTADSLKVEEKILFFSLMSKLDNVPKDTYLYNCLLFGLQVACIQGTLTGSNKIQELLSSAYSSGSKSMQQKIIAFMSSDGRGNESFFRDISWLTLDLLKQRTINTFELVYDLTKWDFGSKDKWVNEIIKVKEESV